MHPIRIARTISLGTKGLEPNCDLETLIYPILILFKLGVGSPNTLAVDKPLYWKTRHLNSSFSNIYAYWPYMGIWIYSVCSYRYPFPLKTSSNSNWHHSSNSGWIDSLLEGYSSSWSLFGSYVFMNLGWGSLGLLHTMKAAIERRTELDAAGKVCTLRSK